MPHDVRQSLTDILTSIDSIDEYLGRRRDFEVYLANKALRRAVERELEIIGEAVGRIKRIDPDFPLENARRIVDLRNWVIHGYDSVDDVIIWGIVSHHLPKLKREVAKLLK